MKDNDLRGLILRKFYEKRRLGVLTFLTDDDFKDLPQPLDFDKTDRYRICDQLAEHGLLKWISFRHMMAVTTGGQGQITALGVDVIEGTAKPTISITYDYSQQHVSVQNSSGVQIGNSNVQDLSVHIGKIISAIDHSTANEQQKAEAKSLLKRFLEHPLVASIAGGLASNIKLP